MKEQRHVFIAIHSLFSSEGIPVSGTGASLFELFSSRNIPFTVLHFPIYGKFKILKVQYTPQKIQREFFIRTPANLLVRTCIESCIALYALAKVGKTPVYIGIDPLNAAWGIVGKYLGRVGKVIYYTADYADSRFGNSVLNRIYHSLDKFCIRHADQIWNVSTRIFERRIAQGVCKDKNYFVPNTPLGDRRDTQKNNQSTLVIVGTSTTALDFEVVLSALPAFIRKFPDIRLHIIGELHFPKRIKDALLVWQRKKIITLHGAMRRDDVFDFLQRSGIGLALYKDVDPWTRFGDSMKIREYLAAGLPVVTTDVVSTSEVIRKFRCGVVTTLNDKSLVRSVEMVYTHYGAMHKQALRAASEYTFERMAGKPLKEMGITV